MKIKRKSGASNPTPTISSVPQKKIKTLDQANALDNVQIKRGKMGKK